MSEVSVSVRETKFDLEFEDEEVIRRLPVEVYEMHPPLVCLEREAENEDKQTNEEQGNGQQNVEQLLRTARFCVGLAAGTNHHLTTSTRELAIRTTARLK